MEDLQSFLDEALKNVKFENEIVTSNLFDYDVEEEVRRLIVSTRVEMGLTQKQISQKTGLSQSNISKIENGTYHPSLLTLKRIADGLEKRLVISFESILGEENVD